MKHVNPIRDQLLMANIEECSKHKWALQTIKNILSQPQQMQELQDNIKKLEIDGLQNTTTYDALLVAYCMIKDHITSLHLNRMKGYLN